MTRYRNNNLSKTLKDYAVPFIGLFLILVLLYNVFSSGDGNNTEVTNNSEINNVKIDEVQVSLGSSESKAYIVYESGKKVEIDESTSLQKSEKIVIESGNVNIDFPLLANVNLGKNGELTYKEDGSLFLESGKMWLEAKSNLDLFMKYSEISMSKGDIVSFYQTEVDSTIYAIDGNIIVSNLAGISAQLKKLEQVTIKSKDASSADINLDSEKKEIGDYFKLSAWFKENNGDKILEKFNTLSGSTLSGSLLGDKKSNIKDLGNLVSFDDIEDESYVKTNKIDLVGKYSALKVGKITIDNIEAKLNKELGTFSLKGFSLNSKTNDLVIKIFDKDLNRISRKVLTIYTQNPSVSSGNSNIVMNNKTLENYPVKATEFYIYEPTKTGKLTTKSSQITIRGKVTNKETKSVLVNGYKLKSYNGSTWRYHAFVEQGTLKNGANNYEIKYLDKDGKLVYKEYYSIYKEFIKVTPKKQKISGEVKVD